MTESTVHPNHQLISSEDVEGTEVFDASGKNIGEVDHLMIDKASGRVAYAVMSFGGFLGLGHSHYISEQQLKDAPQFSDDSWGDRNWETQTHQHYGVTDTYWNLGPRGA